MALIQVLLSSSWPIILKPWPGLGVVHYEDRCDYAQRKGNATIKRGSSLIAVREKVGDFCLAWAMFAEVRATR